MKDIAKLARTLREVVGAGHVLDAEAIAERDPGYCPDNLRASLLVRPADTGEVSAACRAIAGAGRPIVPHGGLTGLVEGAATEAGDVIVSLERMTRIEDVDAIAGTMTVEAGATLDSVQRAAGGHGLMFGLDIGSRGSCTIGGNIATNAGGARVLRYGMMRDNVLGVEAVLADGQVLSAMNRLEKNNAGYDLKHLFIGSEGTLGLVTRAVLRLRQAPASERTALVFLADFEAVVGLFALLGRELAANLVAFEVMWPEYYALTVSQAGYGEPPLAVADGLYGVVEAFGWGHEDIGGRFEGVLETALNEGLVADAVIAKSEAERGKIWRCREDADAVERTHGRGWSYDVGLAIPDIGSYVAETRAAVERFPDLACYFYGHLGDGNLHISIGFADHDPATRRAVERIVYAPIARLGGSVSAEHGIGLEKKPYLAYSRTASEIALMRRLKAALDPHGVFNPGKVV